MDRQSASLTEIVELLDRVQHELANYKHMSDTFTVENKQVQLDAERQLRNIKTNMDNLETQFKNERKLRTRHVEIIAKQQQEMKKKQEQDDERFSKNMADIKSGLSVEREKQVEARSSLKNETENIIENLEKRVIERCKILQDEWREMNAKALDEIQKQRHLLQDVSHDNRFRKDRLKAFITSVQEEVRCTIESITTEGKNLHTHLERQFQEMNISIGQYEAKVEEDDKQRKILVADIRRNNAQFGQEINEMTKLATTQMEDITTRLTHECERRTTETKDIQLATKQELKNLEKQVIDVGTKMQEQWNNLSTKTQTTQSKQQLILDDIIKENLYHNERWRHLFSTIKDTLRGDVAEAQKAIKALKEENAYLQENVEKRYEEFYSYIEHVKEQLNVESARRTYEFEKEHNMRQKLKDDIENVKQIKEKQIEDIVAKLTTEKEQWASNMHGISIETRQQLQTLEYDLQRAGRKNEQHLHTLVENINAKMQEQLNVIEDMTQYYRFRNERWKLLLKEIQKEKDDALQAKIREAEERGRNQILIAERDEFKQRCIKTEEVLKKELDDTNTETRQLRDKCAQLEQCASSRWNNELRAQVDNLKAEIKKRNAYTEILNKRISKLQTIVRDIGQYDGRTYDAYRSTIREWKNEDDRLHEQSEILRRDFLQLSTQLLLDVVLWIERSLTNTPGNCNYANDFGRMLAYIQNARQGDFTRISSEFVFQQVVTSSGAVGPTQTPDIHNIETALDHWITNMAYFSSCCLNGGSQVAGTHLKSYSDATNNFIALLEAHFKSFLGLSFGPKMARLCLRTAQLWRVMADKFQYYTATCTRSNTEYKNCTYWNLGSNMAGSIRTDVYSRSLLCRDYSNVIDDELRSIEERVTKCRTFGFCPDYISHVVAKTRNNEIYLKEVKRILEVLIDTTNNSLTAGFSPATSTLPVGALMAGAMALFSGAFTASALPANTNRIEELLTQLARRP